MINKLKTKALSFFLCIAFLPLWSCSDDTRPAVDVTEIDMENYAVTDFDDLVKDISCIRLEPENVPVFDSCRRMIRFQNYLYLIVSTPNVSDLLIFDESGKYIKSLYEKETFIPVTACAIDQVNNQLLVLVGRSNVLDRYTLDGTLIGREKLPFGIADLVAVDEREYLLHGEGMKDYSLALTDLTDFRKYFLPKEPSGIQTTSLLNMFTRDVATGNVFFHPNYNDTIYRYDNEKETVAHYFHLNFHGDFLSAKDMPKKGYSDREKAEIIERNEHVLGLNSFCLASNRLFFKLSGKRTDICSIDIKNNSLQSFEALFDNFQTSDYNPFVYSDGNSLYFPVRGTALREHYKDNDCSYPAIRQYLSEFPEKEEWILLVIEINSKP
jgi:hypothetical protein